MAKYKLVSKQGNEDAIAIKSTNYLDALKEGIDTLFWKVVELDQCRWCGSKYDTTTAKHKHLCSDKCIEEDREHNFE